MLLRIHHETKLSYSNPVSETVFELRMAPPSNDDQTSMGYHLKISPQAPVTSYRDGFGNRVDLFNITSPYRELVTQATSYVRTHRRSGLDRLSGVSWPASPGNSVAIEAFEYLQPSPLVERSPALTAFVSTLEVPSGTLLDVVYVLLNAVAARLQYEKRVTSTRTPVSEALELGRGVCQDFAHLFLAACRGIHLPARYVSGYVNHPGEIATHAWCQVWGNPQVGWIDVDPTHSCVVENDHVVTAVGRDYSDVPPNRGLWKGRSQETMGVSVTVDPVEQATLEWNEWSPPRPRATGGFSQSHLQSQSQRQGMVGVAPRRAARSAYPNQRSPRAGLHQQQGEQQQQQ
ncbi:transglutaminase family protein [Singulisphaera acidiphila]|uniref:Transglutaminase-like enzyme, predicted cysteine protease n=1 Tax=Singulisphaera acidiphila (strain ATCC BAA-1392 / DSM 18658 / VKM B-2454 / MOB10) TaxID=886293 RepID=L0DMN5_SINAD|nr:transglutaminase family protein [Singulisphaera acidiphila]AGA29921.1 transglutaminase-like enzyme, predicted cysteine protease [Singulisphaera acidiphila DSM 18658]